MYFAEEKADGDSEDEEEEEDQITEVRFVPEDATACELPCDEEIKVNGEIFLAVLCVWLYVFGCKFVNGDQCVMHCYN